MVSFIRGDSPDPALRSAVLKGYKPQQTTVYNTSMEMLQVGPEASQPESFGV